MHKIVPGILEKEWDLIEKKIKLVLPFADTIHIDLLDGKLINNTTFSDPTPFAKYTKNATFELHMMVEEPEQYLEKWAACGFKRFYGHVEKMKDQASFVAKGQLLGEVGLALDGPTGVDSIKVSYDDLDCLLIYTSERIGFSGPPFLKNRLEKIKTLREKTQIPIEVDGGITNETLPKAFACGATQFVSTSFLFSKGSSPQEQFALLVEQLTSKAGF